MKRLLCLVLLLLLLVTCFSGCNLMTRVTINVYNWGQYISDGSDDYIDVIAAFEEAYPNIKVNYMTFDSNESMYTKLKTGGATFDVIIPSDYMVEKLIAEDMLEQLNFDNIPNFEYIDEAYRNRAYDPENLYSVPYTWGSVGVIYNSAYVDEADTGSWDLLWNEKYAGKILMFDNPRDAFAIAQLRLGIDINSENSEELQAATTLLVEQKPLVQSYVMDQVYDKMERSEAWVAPYYAGDYLLMVEENPDLGFYFPEEGYNLFIDAMCIPKGCEHQKEAELFINFLTDPEISGQNLDYLGYSTPLSAAREYMAPETAESPIAYPDEETLSGGQSFNSLSLESTQEMNSLWLNVKTAEEEGEDGIPGLDYLILTCAAIVLVILLWLFFKVRRRRKKAQRCKKWKTEQPGK